MFTLSPGHLTLSFLRQVQTHSVDLTLDAACWKPIENARQTVIDLLATGESVYGINTGFGSLATHRVPDNDLAQLQTRLVHSHAAGTGPWLPDAVVRTTLVLKLNSLARGFSGVRRELIETLLQLIQADILPCIPAPRIRRSQRRPGSVGSHESGAVG